MKPQELVLTCRYSEEETNMAQIIERSFAAFLKRELQNIVAPQEAQHVL